MANITAKYITKILCIGAMAMMLTACIDEEVPKTVVSDKQVAGMSDTQYSMLYGIAAFMVDHNSWGSSDYYLNDWGFPCQMYYRELNGEDFPVYKSTYDYWTYHENGTYASSYTVYTWYYYYKLIRNCNNLIGAIKTQMGSESDSTQVNEATLRYLGSAYAFRAMAYMDLARSFEFKPTGYANLDQTAAQDTLWGLTVPIVTEKTTTADGINNPRVDFCTMYRFIMTDLQEAHKCLKGYNFSDKSLPGDDVVWGLMARAWMEIGSRYEEEGEYLNGYTEKMAESNKNAEKDNYVTIDTLTSKGCYEAAISCVDSIINKYTPVTATQWHDSKTGFNTANDGWMWRCRLSSKEQEPVYYCSFPGQIASEPKSGLAYAYDAYRCIGTYLYKKISSKDWRKTTWVDPSDAGKSTTDVVTKYQSLLEPEAFANVAPYANLKFRPGEGNITDATTWMLGDLPVMRIEEMYFIKAEALARTQDYSTGYTFLKNFVQNHRYTKSTDTYASAVTVKSLSTFLQELMIQKRIEFWGEGICFFDYKRLNLQVNRTLSTNYEDAFKLISKEGYSAPWMNYFIPRLEIQRNTACKANPDVSGEYTE